MVKIVSDFSDYYDILSDENALAVYMRFKHSQMARSEALKMLRGFGIKTVDFGPLKKFNPIYTPKVVVYTNQREHNSLGKRVCTYEEAESQYGNFAVSEFIESDGKTVKYLQIGSRRFRFMFYNSEHKNGVLKEGKLIAYDELPRQFNFALGLPIYSIDYIAKGNDMIAVDFNEVQSLDSIGVNNIMSEKEVISEIHSALLNYHQIKNK